MSETLSRADLLATARDLAAELAQRDEGAEAAIVSARTAHEALLDLIPRFMAGDVPDAATLNALLDKVRGSAASLDSLEDLVDERADLGDKVRAHLARIR